MSIQKQTTRVSRGSDDQWVQRPAFGERGNVQLAIAEFAFPNALTERMVSTNRCRQRPTICRQVPKPARFFDFMLVIRVPQDSEPVIVVFVGA